MPQLLSKTKCCVSPMYFLLLRSKIWPQGDPKFGHTEYGELKSGVPRLCKTHFVILVSFRIVHPQLAHVANKVFGYKHHSWLITSCLIKFWIRRKDISLSLRALWHCLIARKDRYLSPARRRILVSPCQLDLIRLCRTASVPY
jgi:hypothetical protein